ncbi:lysoplasmalogenase family protein [Flavobacterium nackdongense]|uniref:Lysoplasmalogenase n=1 Tax=Flavobacterium nackdongense TaxID=2547394 RepID=A0A4V1AGG5_9FLAO|nr:lysoplasmalogenase family protein [Flavobacterium nackdongense]QBN17962.1 hypothetical protein E1750_03800 [Flavobacterium nackdongense]
MRANKPSLYLYFAACSLVVIFKLLGMNSSVLYAKSAIIPLLFVYYFITNNYKISFVKALIFLFCFIGDIFNLLQFETSPLIALMSFLLVNLLLLKLALGDLNSLKFNKQDRIPIVLTLLFVLSICISVLNLQFENIVFDFSLYILYGVASAILNFVAINNYLKKANFAFLNLMVYGVSSMISDVFFMINKFYLPLFAFEFIQVFVQVFSYFFMVTYFISNDEYKLKIKENEISQ